MAVAAHHRIILTVFLVVRVAVVLEVAQEVLHLMVLVEVLVILVYRVEPGVVLVLLVVMELLPSVAPAASEQQLHS